MADITEEQKNEIIEACNRAIALGHKIVTGCFNITVTRDVWYSGEQCCPLASVADGKEVGDRSLAVDEWLAKYFNTNTHYIWEFIRGFDSPHWVTKNSSSWAKFGRELNGKYE